MKVGGGLNYVTGPMGAGKSFYGVRRIVDALTHSRYCVTNIELREDAFDRIARHYVHLSRAKRRRLSDVCRRHYVFEESISEALKYRLPGSGESRGVFIWDEGHNDLNNRSWRERRNIHEVKKKGDDGEEIKTGRDALLEWATQLRKLGFVGFLLSQHMDNTDAALRRVCNFAIRLQNQREQTRLFGMRITPWPLFLAYWYPANLGMSGQRIPPIRVERYFLGWHRRLYDTFGLFHGLDDAHEDGLILLPKGGVPPAQQEKPAKEEYPHVPRPVLQTARPGVTVPWA